MSRSFRWTIYACGVMSCTLALASLSGWWSHHTMLSSFGRRFIPMAPLTALGFLILSPLTVLGIETPLWTRLRTGLALFAGLVALTGLWIDMQFIRGLSWGLETYFVREPAAFNHVLVGRISPIAAFFFFLTASAQLLSLSSLSSRIRGTAVFLSFLTLGMDTIVLLGYLHHTPLLNGGTIIPMALPTALAFAFLNISTIASTAPHGFPWPYLLGSSARAILLRSFLPVSLAVVFANGLIHKMLPVTWNPGLVGAISALILGGGMILVISNIAIVIGNRIDRVEKSLEEAERSLRRANGELLDAYDKTLEGWAKALDLRDENTHQHCQRVSELTLRLAYAMGLDPEMMVHIRRGAFLHDIGKMGVPDRILLKNGPLNDEEREIMRLHPTYAYDLLSPIAYLKPALDIPYCHHEKWDGTGYPRGLKGEEIPLIARLFSVVDIWDALVSERPYHKPWPEQQVREYLKSLAGSHLDATAVDAFLKMDLQPAFHLEEIRAA